MITQCTRLLLVSLWLAASTTAFAQSAVPGRIEAQFDVDASGSAAYTIPLATPPGTKRMGPQLSLVYSNNQGNGIVGMGWTLQGLPAITRVQPNLEQDGIRIAVSFGANDRYAYDGERLIAISGSDGGNGTTYRTEIESWNFVTSSYAAGGAACGSGPCSFTVNDEDGSILTFGGTTDSQILAAGTSNVRVWALSSIVDRWGNTMSVTYTQTPYTGASVDGQVYPSTIGYTSNAAASLDANRTVTFSYASRTDVPTMYVGGSEVSTTAILTGITMAVSGGAVVQAYNLTYQNAADTGRSVLNSIQQCSGTGSAATCLPATTFAYQAMGTTFNDQGQWSTSWVPGTWTSSLPLALIDVNGDGLADIVGIDPENDLQVSLSTGTSFGAMTEWASGGFGDNWTADTPQLFADVTGDGLGDFVGFNFDNVVVAPATSSSTFDTSDWTSTAFDNYGFDDGYDPTDEPVLLSDVNGDGLADIVGFGPLNTNSASNTTNVSLSTGNSFDAPVPWDSSDFTGTTWFSGLGAIRLVGDVNGDGVGDVVGFGQSGVVVGISNGSSFSTSAWAQNGSTNGYPYFGLNQGWQVGTNARVLADMNGDGLMDIVGFMNGVQVALSTGSGFLTPSTWNSGFSPESTPPWPSSNPVFVVDVNGDGMADVTGFGSSGAAVAISTGSGLSGTWTQSLSTYTPTAQIAMADVNGDGLTDVVSFGASDATATTVALAAGPYPDLLTTITDGIGGQISITYAPMTSNSVYSAATNTSVTTPVATAFFNVPQATVINPITSNFPVTTLANGRIYLVGSWTEQNAANVSSYAYSHTKSYQYTDAAFDLDAGRWLGFATLAETSVNSIETTAFNQAYPQQQTVASKTTSCSATSSDPLCTANTVLLQTSYTYVTPQTATGSGPNTPPVYAVQRASKQDNTFVYGTWDYSIAETYAYDAWGNRNQDNYLGYVTQSGSDLGTNDNVYTAWLYVNNTSPPQSLGFVLYKKQSSTAAGALAFSTFTEGVDLTLLQNTYSTDGLMNLLSSGNWDTSNDAYITTTYTYDGFGNRLIVSQEGGASQTTTYDTTYQTYPSVVVSLVSTSPSFSLTKSYAFDALYGRRIATALPNGNVTIDALDPFGRSSARQVTTTASSTDPSALPSYATGSFNFAGASVNTVRSDTWSSSGASVYVTKQRLQAWPTSSARMTLWKQSFFDGLNQIIQTTTQSPSASGNAVVCRAFDSYGNLTTQTTPAFVSGNSLVCGTSSAPTLAATRLYDAYQRPITETAPSGPTGSGTLTRSYAYTAGNVTTITDAVGTTSSYARSITNQYFNDKSQPASLTVPGSATSTFGYDLLGRMTSAVDPVTTSNPNGVTSSWTWDSLNRNTSSSNPDQGTITYTFNTSQNLAAVATPLTTLTNTYDLLGRITQQTTSDDASVVYTYDQTTAANGLGQLTATSYTNGSGALIASNAFGYDTSGNQATRTMTIGTGTNNVFTTSRTYDPQARVVGMTFPDGSTVARTYATGLLSTLAANGTTYVTYTNPTPAGAAGTVTYQNGLVGTLAYSPMGQLTSDSLANGNTTVASYGFSWSPLNQLASATDQNNDTTSYTYTNLRLTGVSAPSGTSSYSYDASGNLITADGNTYAYTAHQPTSATNAQQQTILSLSYDAAGNVTSRVASGTTTSFTYDANGRMLTAGDVTYAYDYDGTRISRTDSSGNVTMFPDAAYEVLSPSSGTPTITRYLVDDLANRVVALSSSSPAPAPAPAPRPRRFPRRRPRVDATVSLTPLFIHTSPNISTFLTTDASGNTSTEVSYDPYGFPTLDGPSNFDPLFTGRDFDSASSLYDFDARWYDPTTLHFTSPDSQLGASITEQDSLNRYAYVGSDPVNRTDPSGNVWELITAAGAQLASKANQLMAAAEQLQNTANVIRQTGQALGDIAEEADVDAFSDDSLVAAQRLAGQLEFIAGEVEAEAAELQATAQAVLNDAIPFLENAAETTATFGEAVDIGNIALADSLQVGAAATAATASAGEAVTATATVLEAGLTDQLVADESLVAFLALFGV